MQVCAVHRDGKGAERVFHLWPMSGGEVWSMMVDHAMSDADKIDEKHQKILSDWPKLWLRTIDNCNWKPPIKVLRSWLPAAGLGSSQDCLQVSKIWQISLMMIFISKIFWVSKTFQGEKTPVPSSSSAGQSGEIRSERRESSNSIPANLWQTNDICEYLWSQFFTLNVTNGSSLIY